MGSEEPASGAQGPPETDNGTNNGAQPKGRTPFRVYVGGLNFSTTTDTLRRAFEDFAAVVEGTEVIYDRNNKSKGFGFVNFVEAESMKKAIEKMDGVELDGRKIQVMLAQPEKFGPREMGGYSGPRPPYGYTGGGGPGNRGFRVSIQGIAPAVTWRDLKDFLRQAGEVRFADVVGPGIGMGEFATAADRASAVRTLNGKELKGSKLHMKDMEESDMRFGSGGGGGGGSGSGFGGPRGPGFFNNSFSYDGFDMPYGPGFDHYGYGSMGPMDFNPMSFPPPPRMPGWGRGGPRHPGYGSMGPYQGSQYGRGSGRMDGRWNYGGYSRPNMGRGYDRNSMRGYDMADSGRGYEYDRMGDGYARGGQGGGNRSAGYEDRAGERGYGGYKDRYPPGAGEGYPGYAPGKEDWGYGGNYGGRGNAESHYGRYESGQNSAYERNEADGHGYSGYRQGEDRREYPDYPRNAGEEERGPREYNRSGYGGYSGSGYVKQAGEQGYEYEKNVAGVAAVAGRAGEEYGKYRNEEVYPRGERGADGYAAQERREYEYARADGRSYSGDYKTRETDYYADRRGGGGGEYGNSTRSYREEDPRGAGGADRRRTTRSHRTGPYDR